MRREQVNTVREVAAARKRSAARHAAGTKQMHQRLLRALGDRRLKRAFGS